MKLIDYLEKPENKKLLSADDLKKYEDNACLCEVHQTDLFIVDGYTITGLDIQYYPDWDFEDNNPNNLYVLDSFEKPTQFQSEEKKIIYCKTCVENTEKHYQSEPTEKRKKVKGRKSKKYQTEKSRTNGST